MKKLRKRKKVPRVNCRVRVAGRQPTSGQSRRCYCRTWGRACRIERNRPLGCCSKEKRWKTARKWWACSRLRESSDAAGPRRPSLAWPGRRPASVPGARHPHHTTRMKTQRCWWTLAADWRNCSRVATFLAIRRSKAFQSHCRNKQKIGIKEKQSSNQGLEVLAVGLLEDFGKLIRFRLAAKEWLPAEEFGEDASARPNVDRSGVARRQQHFRRSVP